MAIVWLNGRRYHCYVKGYFLPNAQNPKEFIRVPKYEAVEFDGRVLIELPKTKQSIYANLNMVYHDSGANIREHV